jgi:hypothetical protein
MSWPRTFRAPLECKLGALPLRQPAQSYYVLTRGWAHPFKGITALYVYSYAHTRLCFMSDDGIHSVPKHVMSWTK